MIKASIYNFFGRIYVPDSFNFSGPYLLHISDTPSLIFGSLDSFIKKFNQKSLSTVVIQLIILNQRFIHPPQMVIDVILRDSFGFLKVVIEMFITLLETMTIKNLLKNLPIRGILLKAMRKFTSPSLHQVLPINLKM